MLLHPDSGLNEHEEQLVCPHCIATSLLCTISKSARSSMSSRRIQTAGYEAASVRFFSPLVWTSALSSAAMSLAFLSKKGWHTSNLQNVEKVWIAEQKQEKEAKRVLELQKQIEEERQIDDLRALQRNQGLVTDPREKLEWMYEGPSSGAAQDRAPEHRYGSFPVLRHSACSLAVVTRCSRVQAFAAFRVDLYRSKVMQTGACPTQCVHFALVPDALV